MTLKQEAEDLLDGIREHTMVTMTGGTERARLQYVMDFLASHGGMISVEESLPPPLRTVVCWDTEERDCFRGFLNNGLWWNVETAMVHHGVSHWIARPGEEAQS